MDLTGTKLLVTGAHGCIGAWITKLALDGGAEVIAFDQTVDPWRLRLIAPGYDARRLRLVQGAIDDTAAVKKLVKDSGVSHIAHMAAVLMPYCAANPVSGGLIDVIGTLNVFEAARDAGRNVRITYASSSAVWGPPTEYGDRDLSEGDTTAGNRVLRKVHSPEPAAWHNAEAHISRTAQLDATAKGRERPFLEPAGGGNVPGLTVNWQRAVGEHVPICVFRRPGRPPQATGLPHVNRAGLGAGRN